VGRERRGLGQFHVLDPFGELSQAKLDLLVRSAIRDVRPRDLPNRRGQEDPDPEPDDAARRQGDGLRQAVLGVVHGEPQGRHDGHQRRERRQGPQRWPVLRRVPGIQPAVEHEEHHARDREDEQAELGLRRDTLGHRERDAGHRRHGDRARDQHLDGQTRRGFGRLRAVLGECVPDREMGRECPALLPRLARI
jgi:hypothetical protein